jgi:hypothetical protein
LSDTELGAAVFTLSADGTVEADLGDDFEQEFAGALTGKGETYAIEALQEIEGVERFDVDYGPDWLPWKPAPQLSNRITVAIDGT